MLNGKSFAVDLYCGLGGWTEGFLAEGWQVVGFDIERHQYPRAITSGDAVKRPGMNWSDRSKRGAEAAMFNKPPELDPQGGWDEYPAELVLQDVLTLHGSQFRNADCIVASPPCQAYSYRAMPWKRAKALPPPDNTLFEACFRIQREASEAAGRHIPMVVENVCGAQRWVGRAAWHFGSFYLWGDVPALMPLTLGRKNQGGSWFAVAHNTTSGHSHNPDGRKLPGNNSPRLWADRRVARLRDAVKLKADYMASSGSPDRKAASAQIAKIPFALANWIARVYKPT